MTAVEEVKNKHKIIDYIHMALLQDDDNDIDSLAVNVQFNEFDQIEDETIDIIRKDGSVTPVLVTGMNAIETLKEVIKEL